MGRRKRAVGSIDEGRMGQRALAAMLTPGVIGGELELRSQPLVKGLAVPWFLPKTNGRPLPE